MSSHLMMDLQNQKSDMDFSRTDYENWENVYFTNHKNLENVDLTDHKNLENVDSKELDSTLCVRREHIYDFYYGNYVVFIEFLRNIIFILKSIPNLDDFLNLKLTYLYKAGETGFTYMFEFVNPNNKDITHLCLSFNNSHYLGDIYFAKNYKYDDKPLVSDETLKSEFNIPFFTSINIEDNDLRSNIISLFKALYGCNHLE